MPSLSPDQIETCGRDGLVAPTSSPPGRSAPTGKVSRRLRRARAARSRGAPMNHTHLTPGKPPSESARAGLGSRRHGLYRADAEHAGEWLHARGSGNPPGPDRASRHLRREKPAFARTGDRRRGRRAGGRRRCPRARPDVLAPRAHRAWLKPEPRNFSVISIAWGFDPKPLEALQTAGTTIRRAGAAIGFSRKGRAAGASSYDETGGWLARHNDRRPRPRVYTGGRTEGSNPLSANCFG